MASLSEHLNALQGAPGLKRVLNGLFGSMVSSAPAAVTALAPPAGGAGTAAGAWDTAANRDLAIASITALRNDVIALRATVATLTNITS